MDEHGGEWNWGRIALAAAIILAFFAAAYFLFFQPGGILAAGGRCAPFPSQIDGYGCVNAMLACSDKNEVLDCEKKGFSGLESAYTLKYEKEGSYLEYTEVVYKDENMALGIYEGRLKTYSAYCRGGPEADPSIKCENISVDGGRGFSFRRDSGSWSSQVLLYSKSGRLVVITETGYSGESSRGFDEMINMFGGYI